MTYTIGFLLALATLTPTGENLAKNPSFETIADGEQAPATWRGHPDTFSQDVTATRDGKASLKYSNDNPDRYRLCTQSIPLEPGCRYRFGAQVKVRDIKGGESGATLCVEWRDKGGKWLGGSYPTGLKGTRDWQLVEGVATVPTNAGACTLSCYVRRGMTGTAWFDDVNVQRMVGPPMRTALLKPNYRGQIPAGANREAHVRVWLNTGDHDLLPQHTSLVIQTIGPDGPVGDETRSLPNRAGQIDVSVSLPASLRGECSLVIRLVGRNGKTLQTNSHSLTTVNETSRPSVFIDAHQRCIVDGKPFFPIGMYWSTIKKEDIELYSGSAFNCVMPYGRPTREQMDLAHAHGIKVIYSTKDFYYRSRWCPGFIKSKADEEIKVREYVRQFRDHPALLAWYLNDELPLSFLDRLKAHQRWTAEEDPNHPTWVVLYQYRQVRDYLETFDVIGTDPYPIGRRPVSDAGVWTAETKRQVCGARPLWQVPQLHNWSNYKPDDKNAEQYHTPTRDELRSMAWQCICEGAMGLVFYSWRDIQRNPDVSFDAQWAYLKEIAAEIDDAAPALLSVEPCPEVKVAATPEDPRWLHTLVRRHGDTIFLFVANNGDADGRITVTLPKGWSKARVDDGSSTPAKTPDGFSDRVGALQVRIYEISP